MAEKFTTLVQLRGRQKGSITRTLSFAENAEETHTLEHVVTRLGRLEETWQEFVQTTNKMYTFNQLSEYVDPDTDFFEYEAKYLQARARLSTIKNDLTPGSTDAQQSDLMATLISEQTSLLQQVSAKTSDTELPKVNIQPFSGVYKDWPSFKDIFLSTIDSKSSLSNTHKFYYLKGLLKDDAANLVRHLPVTETAYKTAWSRLQDRFERSRQIINSFIETFMALPSASCEDHIVLRRISDGANEIIRGLDAISHSERDCWIIHLLLAKVDPESRRAWIHESRDESAPTISDFFEFLDSRCEELELSQRKCTTGRSSARKVNPTSSVRSYVTTEDNSQKLEDRRAMLKSKSLCFNCIKPGHTSYNCKSRFRCKECRRRHHTLVHPIYLETTSSPSQAPPVPLAGPTNVPWSTVAHLTRPVPLLTSSQLESSPTKTNPAAQLGKHSLLPTAVVYVEDGQGQFNECRVLIDTASELSYISEPCVKRLGLKSSHSRIAVSGISAAKAETTRGCCFVHIQSRTCQQSFTACLQILCKITSKLPGSPLDASAVEQFNGLTLADPYFHIPAHIDILLGVQYVWNILTMEKAYDVRGNTIAVSSIFGWIATSTLPTLPEQTISLVTVTDLDNSLRCFWEIEEPNQVKFTDPNNDFVEQHFLATHSRSCDGRYTVELPFKQEGVTFGDTIQGAISRFYAVERRFSQNETLREEYVAFMKEYIRLGHMRELPSNEIEVPDGRVFYMPHHPVLGQKLRVVFEGSFQDTHGVSLNDTLHIGPSIQRNLFAVWLRFRFHRFVFSADIVKMFRQIWVCEQHRNFQRIVWRDDPDQQLKHFQLCTVTYGTSCAPFLSVRVLEQLASDYKNEHPVASRILKEDFYVDDVLTGAPSEEDLKRKKDDLVKLLSYAGLQLRKWISNCHNIIPEAGERSDKEFFKGDEHKGAKVLGVYWRPNEDVLFYKVCLRNPVSVCKRQVLSDASRIFDPLGLLAPVVVNFKILFQDLWLHNLHWDDPLPAELAVRWTRFREDLKNLDNLKLPRFVDNDPEVMELHGFSDASTKAYAAVVYSKKTENSKVCVSLIAAKTRVAPLKQVSLPRLELCGALLLTRLMKTIINSLTHTSIKIHAWCDSTVVLAWLSQPPVKLKTFVGNRTAEILDTLPRSVWNHVISKENPADCASRGMLAKDLLHFHLWWNGPSWLQVDSANVDCVTCIESPTNPNVAAEFKSQTASCVSTVDQADNPFEKPFGYVLSFTKRLLTRIRKTTPQITLSKFDEMRLSRLECLRQAQGCYQLERNCLKGNGTLDKKSKLLKLAPFLDNDELIRVGGRIQHSLINEETRHPIILPKNHRITHLILQDEHVKNLHPGTTALFFIVRQKFWIVGARNLIRKLTFNCIKCFRQKQIDTKQMMANLPAVRVRQAYPFEKTGCDYAGPFILRLYRGRNARTSKGYICLFICLVTTAIHLELATDLSTECFLAALRRFMSRRGKCAHIFSDNGRNFVGAARALNEMHKLILSKAHNEIVAASLAEDGIRWSFIPPFAPHWGGIWESAVRSVKFRLRRVVGASVLTFEQMSTLLTQVEAVISSRPIGAVSDSDIDYLSPSHFLLGRPCTMVPEANIDHIHVNRLTYWQSIQSMYQGFWRRWHEKYLTSLQSRAKWYYKETNVAVGNIVVVKDANSAPAKWIMARVTEVFPDADGLVRVVKLHSVHGDFIRPISKIVTLPIL